MKSSFRYKAPSGMSRAWKRQMPLIDYTVAVVQVGRKLGIEPRFVTPEQVRSHIRVMNLEDTNMFRKTELGKHHKEKL